MRRGRAAIPSFEILRAFFLCSKGKDMNYDEQLAMRVRQFLDGRSVGFEEKRMFGGVCFMIDGKMCVGVANERLMARIDPEIYEMSLRRKGCVLWISPAGRCSGSCLSTRKGFRRKTILHRGSNLRSSSIPERSLPEKSAKTCRLGLKKRHRDEWHLVSSERELRRYLKTIKRRCNEQ